MKLVATKLFAEWLACTQPGSGYVWCGAGVGGCRERAADVAVGAAAGYTGSVSG